MTTLVEQLKDIAIITGATLQVIGLAVVIYQLTRLNASIRTSSQSALYQQATSIRTVITDHPHLRKYFFDGEPIDPSAEQYDRTVTIAEMFLNYLEHLLIQKDTLRHDDWRAWRRFVRHTLEASPVMQLILQEPDKARLYSSELVEIYIGLAADKGKHNS